MKLTPVFLFRTLTILLVLFTIVVSFQNYYLPEKQLEGSDQTWTEYNNYQIFADSFFHLKDNKNLYLAYPQENYDLYKYSPTFALFMGLFAYLPDLLGLIFWNLLNALVLLSALRYLPELDQRKKTIVLAFIFIELITSLQNSQSNPLMVGLILWAFIAIENKKIALATLFICLSVFIKVFGILAFAIFIFYPQKGKAIFYAALWSILLFLLPIVLISLPDLIQQYQNWFTLLQNDHSASVGLSVMAWFQTWFGISNVKNIILIPGVLLLLAPLVRVKHYSSLQFRYWFLSSLLIWMVIFNHKAESPTFIIAIVGVAIWYVSQARSKLNLILLLLAFIFTILSPTDIFPKTIRENWVIPYVLKAFPCILIWFKITFNLLFNKNYLLTLSKSSD
jgi:hypothetical protein